MSGNELFLMSNIHFGYSVAELTCSKEFVIRRGKTDHGSLHSDKTGRDMCYTDKRTM